MSSWILQYLQPDTPADATAVRKQGPAPLRTIGPATRGNIPLPRGRDTGSPARIGDPNHSILDLVRTGGPAINPIAAGQDALTSSFNAGRRASDALDRGKYGQALGEAAGTALTAGTFAIPEGALAGILGKGAKALDRYAILTAENAGGHAMSAAENTARRASLEAELHQRGYKFTPVVGRYQDPSTGEILSENSYLVHGMPEREAKLVGKRYGQNGVITQQGYHDLVDNKFFPSSGTAEASDLPYTQLPNGKRFALNIDWKNPQTPTVNSLPVPKNANPEVLRVADQLRQGKDITNLPRIAKVDPRAGKLMAQAYESLPKNEPGAKSAYDALNAEVAQQYKTLEDAGYKFEYTDSDPYKSSREMMQDVQQNRRLQVYKTPRPTGRISAAAIRLPDGSVFEGKSHWPAIEAAQAAGKLPDATHPDFERLLSRADDGFVDDANQFLSRDETAARMKAAGLSTKWSRDNTRFPAATEDILEGQNGFAPKVQFHPYMTPEQNDRFRAVHDLLAHAGEGHQFGPTGEENAYRVHASTLSPLAQQALATETRGQNSWVNFGPFSGKPAAERPFAEQKAALFPKNMLGDYGDIQQPDASTLGSVGVRPPGFGPAYPNPASTEFYPPLSSLLKEAESAPVNSAATRASVRPGPADMEIPAGVKRAALDSVVTRAAPAVLTAPNSGDVFDISKLGLNVPAGVNTQRPPLKRPTRADLSSLSGVPRKFREVYTPNAERAMRDTPEAAGWYDMSQVRDAMSDLSPEGADDFKKFMLFMGPTSIGTKVPDNLRQASKFFQLYKNGELDLNALKNGTLELPQGYANRRQKSVNSGITKILENGNLDPYTTPKTYRYANQLAGDMWGGAALDMHVGRQVGKRGLIPDANGELVPETGFPAPSYSKENPMVSTSPSPTQYAHIEDSLVRQASNLGLTPAQYQALGWVGGGAQTGVSDTRPLLAIFNQKLKDTAAKYGFNSPMDAFTAFAQGKTPLWAMLPAAAMGGGLLYGNDQQR